MLGKQRPHALRIGLALCTVLAALSGACKRGEPRTQVMLIIDAEEQARARATRLEVNFESRSELNHIDGVPYTETFATVEGSAPYWPFSIALLPRSGDARRSYHITATLYEGEASIAVLRAHSGFVPQRTLELQLMFSADCLDQQSLECSDQQTCLYGDCLSAFVDAESLAELGGNAAVVATADGGILTGRSAPRTGSQLGTETGTRGAGGMSSPNAPGDAGADSGATPAMSAGNCGDGQVNEGEACDTAIAQGMEGACPELCMTVDPCEPLQLEGAACQTRCMGYRIQNAMSGDGCCPTGNDANSDMDCAARCGNGIIEAGETCDPIDTCPTAGSSCAGANACLVASVEGDAASCTAICVMHPIEACMAGDGCCPASCAHDSDSDCSASCGNGVVDMAAGELCEPSSTDLPCPTSCDDANPCTEDFLTGSASNCNATCTHSPITLTINRDGCCPPERGNANNDSDCQAICGNRVVERGEFCDGLCPTQATQCNDLNACTRDGLTGSECGVRCTYDLINVAMNSDSCCPFGANANNDNDCRPACGNSVIESGELCDGNCPTSCRDDGDNNPCTVNVVTGGSCQRRCEAQRLSASTARMDGCCPAGADSSTDSDCMPPPATCGNGLPDPGETCDPCPTSCPEPRDCTSFVLRGSGCNVTCMPLPITLPAPGDSCCPDGENSSTDSDCTNPPPALCGNHMQDPGETCDPCPPSCPEPRNCMSFVLRGSGCNVTCSPVPITSPAPGDNCCPDGANSSTDSDCTNPPPAVCPNGHVEEGELCDPCTCVDTDPCTREVTGGSGCRATCSHDPIGPSNGGTDGCCPDGANSSTDSDCNNPPPAVCGNGRTEPGEDCDGNCPSCNDSDPCTTDMSIPIPDACHPMCRYSAVPPRLSGPDGCCPPNADSTTDSDCLSP